ncbi:prolipoprotein diacylglyceryl transferase [Chondrinema litorale]|uniref:prolipoprotein diacylglyceryl transferase n=1 Tax=Chondrinema litorale TaxID=2994555 RepID=UPI002542A8B4|nr:prolipoprotein diacylglyceryl transferase [Chondrinema litorale]UZR99219.1 prolipoprotein diacylglyceryl transferase [Chondrinema litorale]
MNDLSLISYIIWNVDPRIFPSIDILRWYGLMWSLGMFAAFKVMTYIYRKEQQYVKETDQLLVYLAIGAILGARLGHIFFYDFSYYWQHPIELLPFRFSPEFEFTGISGLASHGGIIGAFLALLLFTHKYKRSYLWLLDRLIIAGALLGCFIRFGNLMNSEIIGIETNVKWAFIFTKIDMLPRHPAQLYESIFYLFTFILLFTVWYSRKFYKNNGFLFGLGILLIFAQRFFIEFFKVDQVPFEKYLPLNMGQLLSVPFILIGLASLILSIRLSKKNVLIP